MMFLRAVMVATLARVARALVIPVTKVGFAPLPLDILSLELPRVAVKQLALESQGGPRLLGLVDGDPVPGARGVLCEVVVVEAGEGETVRVRAHAFSRYEVSEDAREGAGPTRLCVCEVRPVVDVEPEDDALLREECDLLARRDAMARDELRVHLEFCRMEQLLSWTDERLSPGPSTEAEGVAVHRFAPRAAETLSIEVDDDDDDAAAFADECRLDADSEACLLERSFLAASAVRDGSLQGRTPEMLADFTASRRELYSFAVLRALGVSRGDSTRLVGGTSTAERLRVAERRLATTNQWLANRMSLGDLATVPDDPWAEPDKGRASPKHAARTAPAPRPANLLWSLLGRFAIGVPASR